MFTLKNKDRVLLLIFILFSVVSFFAPMVSSHGEGEEPAELLVLVNGDSITTVELNAQLMKSHSAMKQMTESDFDFRILLEKLVNDYLILQEAYSLNMDQEDWIVEYLDEKTEKRAMKKYAQSNFKPDLTITDEELNEFFTDYYFKMILRTVSLNSKDEADNCYNLIMNGAPMDSLANAVSIDSRKFQGGLHKIKFYADIDTTLRAEAIKLENGEVSQPFPFLDGYIILKLEQRFPPDSNDLGMLNRKLTGMLTGQKQEKAWNLFVDSLLEVNSVMISDDILEQIHNDASVLFSDKFIKKTDSIAVNINDSRLITEEDLRKKISHTAMSHGTKTIYEISEIALRELLTEEVIIDEALSNGYLETPEMQSFYYEVLDSILIEVYLKEMIVSKIKFNRQEFDEYYKSHSDDFRNPDKFQFDQLNFTDKDTAQYYVDILNEGADIEFIKKQIIPDYIEEPVDVEWTLATLLPQKIQDDLKYIQPGHAVGPYEVKNGWLLFYVLNRDNGTVKPYNEVENEIRQVFFQKIFNEKLDAHIQVLKDNSQITYFEDKVNKYFEE